MPILNKWSPSENSSEINNLAHLCCPAHVLEIYKTVGGTVWWKSTIPERSNNHQGIHQSQRIKSSVLIVFVKILPFETKEKNSSGSSSTLVYCLKKLKEKG